LAVFSFGQQHRHGARRLGHACRSKNGALMGEVRIRFRQRGGARLG
jgi:hypothetical protein